MARAKELDRQAIYLNFVKYCRPGREGLPDFVSISKKFGGLNALKKDQWEVSPPIDKIELIKKATALSEKYLLSETELLKLLWHMSWKEGKTHSKPNFKSGEISNDLPDWKSSHANLKQLYVSLSKTETLLEDISQDSVACGGLSYVAPGENIASLVNSLFVLAGVVEAALDLEINRGRRRHPVRLHEATKRCKEFWQKQKNQEPIVHFSEVKSGGGSQPDNPFSRWFCDVMKIVFPKISESTCNTLLRQQRAPKSRH